MLKKTEAMIFKSKPSTLCEHLKLYLWDNRIKFFIRLSINIRTNNDHLDIERDCKAFNKGACFQLRKIHYTYMNICHVYLILIALFYDTNCGLQKSNVKRF